LRGPFQRAKLEDAQPEETVARVAPAMRRRPMRFEARSSAADEAGGQWFRCIEHD
jgi:hypothetical protein